MKHTFRRTNDLCISSSGDVCMFSEALFNSTCVLPGLAVCSELHWTMDIGEQLEFVRSQTKMDSLLSLHLHQHMGHCKTSIVYSLKFNAD